MMESLWYPVHLALGVIGFVDKWAGVFVTLNLLLTGFVLYRLLRR